MPSPKTSPVTFPNSFKTPTLPVGIEVVLAISRVKTSNIPRILSKRLRKTAKPGIPLIPPPKSMGRPVLVIVGSYRNEFHLLTAFAHLASLRPARATVRMAMPRMHHGPGSDGQRIPRNPQLPQPA